MRVLVSVRPYWGHLQPVIPLLEVLVRRGHQVVVATTEDLAVEVEERGFGWTAAGVHPAKWRGDGDPNYGLDTVRVKTNDLLATAGDVPTHLVVRDATDLAAAIAADVMRLPVVTFSVSHYLPAQLWRRFAGPTLDVLRREHRLPPDPLLESLTVVPYLDLMPPMLQGDEVAELHSHHPLRYSPRDDVPAGSDPRPPPTDNPTVLVTLGTVYNDRARVWRVFVRALSDLDLTVIATGLPDGLAGLGRTLPANVRRVGFVPHSWLLPDCQLVVCHGGFNTVLGAICAGVPMVCVPLAGDQYYNGEVVDRLGLGIRLRASRLTPAQLREAVGEILADPSYAARVDGVRRSIAELPPTASVVPMLERLAGSAP